MSLSIQDVEKIARLARIRLRDEEKEPLARELGSILKMVEQLSEVDTGEAELVASVIEHPLPWREDEVTDGGRHADILANAPKSEYGCFVVPKVIGES